jgi:hypothetical protein
MCLYEQAAPHGSSLMQDLAMTRTAAETNDLATSTNGPKSAWPDPPPGEA